MLKVNNRSTRCHAGVFITTLNIFDTLCFFSNFEHVMADGILYCLNLNLSMYFRVGSRSPVTFKTNLYVTTVNNSFRLLASSLMLHRRELNNMTWSTKILKSIDFTLGKIWKTHPHRCPKNTFSEVFRIKYYAFTVISNGLYGVSINSLT